MDDYWQGSDASVRRKRNKKCTRGKGVTQRTEGVRRSDIKDVSGLRH